MASLLELFIDYGSEEQYEQALFKENGLKGFFFQNVIQKNFHFDLWWVWQRGFCAYLRWIQSDQVLMIRHVENRFL